MSLDDIPRGTSETSSPVSDPDYSTWLTKQQAADAIGVTTKTVERLAQDGQVQQARWRRPTGGPELAVYHPDDVDRIARERRPGPLAPFLVPGPARGNTHAPTNGTPDHAEALARVPTGEPRAMAGDDLLHALTLLMSKVMSETSQTSALFLTIREASAVSGLSQACLKRLIADGTLKAIRDRSWRIRRRDLEVL